MKTNKKLSFAICIFAAGEKVITRETPVIDHIPLAHKRPKIGLFYLFSAHIKIPFKVGAITCKNYLLKIYSQHGNFLNGI